MKTPTEILASLAILLCTFIFIAMTVHYPAKGKYIDYVFTDRDKVLLSLVLLITPIYLYWIFT